jgi:hypothetical protein
MACANADDFFTQASHVLIALALSSEPDAACRITTFSSICQAEIRIARLPSVENQ